MGNHEVGRSMAKSAEITITPITSSEVAAALLRQTLAIKSGYQFFQAVDKRGRIYQMAAIDDGDRRTTGKVFHIGQVGKDFTLLCGAFSSPLDAMRAHTCNEDHRLACERIAKAERDRATTIQIMWDQLDEQLNVADRFAGSADRHGAGIWQAHNKAIRETVTKIRTLSREE